MARVQLDDADRRDYEDRYLELEARAIGVQAAIDDLRDRLSTDEFDRGNKVDYRHHAKGRKAYTVSGRHVTHRPALAFDTAYREAEARLRTLRAEQRLVKHELRETDAVLSRGWREGSEVWLGAARRRTFRPRWTGRPR